MKLQRKKRYWLLVFLLLFASGTLFPQDCCRENPFRKASLRRWDPNAWQDPKEVLKEAIRARREAEKMRRDLMASNHWLRGLRRSSVDLRKMIATRLMVIPYRYLLHEGRVKNKRRDEKRKNKTFLIKVAQERLFTNLVANPLSP